MRTVFFLLCLLLTCSAIRAEYVVLNRIHFLGADGWMDFLVPPEELRKVRPWEPGAGIDAPLSRSQALEIARKAAIAEGLDISDVSSHVISLTKMNRFEEDLIKHLPPGSCRWFYQVDFKGVDARIKGEFTFLVTMSGAVASKAVGPK